MKTLLLVVILASASACSNVTIVDVDWASPPRALEGVEIRGFEPESWIEFPVPGDALGFTLVAFASADDETGIPDLISPSGLMVARNWKLLDLDDYFVETHDGVGSLSTPRFSDALLLEGGTWRFRVPRYVERVQIWVRRTADGDFHGGAVDFDVYFGGGPITKLYFDGILDQVFPFAGLDLGEVRYHRVSDRQLVFDDLPEVWQVGVPTLPSIRVAVVDDVPDGFWGHIVGAPLPMLSGERVGGAAVEISGDPTSDAWLLAHELGHVGRLIHTSDFGREHLGPHDLLDDTEECSEEVFTNDAKACPDVNNLMFPYPSTGSMLSEEQITVVQAAPFYRGIVNPGDGPESLNEPTATVLRSVPGGWQR